MVSTGWFRSFQILVVILVVAVAAAGVTAFVFEAGTDSISLMNLPKSL